MTLLAVESRFAWNVPIRVVGTEIFEPHALSSYVVSVISVIVFYYRVTFKLMINCEDCPQVAN